MEDWEGRQELISEHFPGIVYVYDVKPRRLSYVNARAGVLLGCGPAEVSRWKEDWRELVYPDDRTMAAAALDACHALAPGEYHIFDCRLIHRKDRWRHFRIQGSVLRRDRDHNPASLLFIAQEQAPFHPGDNARQLDDFAYAASHDLHEPLRKIAIWGERLRQKFGDVLGEEGRAYLSRMAASTETMRRLIDSLLELSRITRDKASYALTDLNGLFAEVRQELGARIDEAGASITCGPLPAIVCNPGQIKQLFLHLLGNSLKFRRPERTPSIEVRGEAMPGSDLPGFNLPPGTDYYTISFRDNGIGFEQAHADRIFAAFQRLHGRSEYPGPGVGLAVCKKIAAQHGGEIRAFGTPGDGAIFNVILPATQLSF